MLIDTHCHLDFPDFDSDRDEVIKRARSGGIERIVNIGCNLERAKKAVEIAGKYDFIFAAVGLHPQEAEDGDDKFFSRLREFLKESKVAAIGECGLEFYGPKDNLKRRRQQEKVLLKHLEFAEEFNKPVIIHCRNGYPEILEILAAEKKKNPGLAGVVHFFSGKLSEARALWEIGFLVSFTGVITFARDYDKVIKAAPLGKLMVETDSPYVAPEPFRGKRNEPLYVRYVAEKIAEIKGLSFDEVARTTTENARNLFKI